MFNMFQKQKTDNQQQVAPPDDQIYLDLEIYVLYDSKVGTYRLPSFQASKWDVIRNLEQMFEDPQQAQTTLCVIQKTSHFLNLADTAASSVK